MIMTVLSLLLRAIVVLFGTALVTFALLWNAPGDPAQAIAMARFDALLTEDVIDQVRRRLGWTRPSGWPFGTGLDRSWCWTSGILR